MVSDGKVEYSLSISPSEALTVPLGHIRQLLVSTSVGSVSIEFMWKVNQRFQRVDFALELLERLSLQCRRIWGARVHIFLLGRHLGFSTSRGLGRGDIRRGSRG